MSQLARLFRSYWLGLYWLVFAVYTLYAATYPGYVRNPEAIPYPWLGVFCTWGFLAVLTYVFHIVLKPPAFLQSRKRLALAIAIASGLVAISVITMVTDQPGYYYVPMQFSFITFLALVVCAIVLAGVALWRYTRLSGRGDS